jgi:hypothetical protein
MNCVMWKFHNLQSSLNIIRIIKLRGWEGKHVACIGRWEMHYKIWVIKPEGKIPLGRHIHRWKDNIKMDHKIDLLGCVLDYPEPVQGPGGFLLTSWWIFGFCKDKKMLDQLSDHQLSKRALLYGILVLLAQRLFYF